MSAIADIFARMLQEIDSFLSETGMAASYFGKLATNNSKLVERLRLGGDMHTATAEKVRAFIAAERARLEDKKRAASETPPASPPCAAT